MPQSNKIFQRVGNASPGRSTFDLSYAKLFNANAGELIPVMHDEVVPGDVVKIGCEMIVRMQPMVAPVLHEINAYVHYFFVPYRILWDDWESFITGGADGNDTSTLPVVNFTAINTTKGTLWDMLGFPVGSWTNGGAINPVLFPFDAYYAIWNEWYRDQTLQTEKTTAGESGELVLRNWEKDYFTSSLPWQQRGTAPALPISGTSSAVFTKATGGGTEKAGFKVQSPGGTGADVDLEDDASDIANFNTMFSDNEVDLSSATTFDVADLRLAFQIQKWMERNARAGARYTEFLKAHFGVSPRDDRLDRPEYIGGHKQSLVVSEVLQTSSTDGTSAQANMAGHGLSADAGNIGRYRVEEYGIIMGLMSIMPRTAYSQGIDRQWLKQTRYDYYHPEFANLSEQPIYDAELYYQADSTDLDVFGYQGRYDEMRTKKDLYARDMRDTFSYWHLGRIFASEPALNEAFIECDPATRIFASETEPGYLVHFQNKIIAARPMPIMSNPGLIDH